MDLSLVVMWVGFLLASYSVVGNDVIQTLGTFLTSNEKRVQWYILWLFAGGILSATLIYGFYFQDVTYGRLDKFAIPETYHWYYLLPPIVLLTITRWGIPVSTTFMILTLFSLQKIPGDLSSMFASIFDPGTELGGMIKKSIFGYGTAFFSAIIIYLLISQLTERYFLNNKLKRGFPTYAWTIAQWLSTGFLWSQWLSQDLANIYIYLGGGKGLGAGTFYASLFVLVSLLGYIFYIRGGAVQEVVRKKTNTEDIRAATFIDLIYGVILYIFKYDYLGIWGGNIPMSTTWVFIGLLAGREIGIQLALERRVSSRIGKLIGSDLLKVSMGLLISLVLVFIIKLVGG